MGSQMADASTTTAIDGGISCYTENAILRKEIGEWGKITVSYTSTDVWYDISFW